MPSLYLKLKRNKVTGALAVYAKGTYTHNARRRSEMNDEEARDAVSELVGTFLEDPYLKQFDAPPPIDPNAPEVDHAPPGFETLSGADEGEDGSFEE